MHEQLIHFISKQGGGTKKVPMKLDSLWEQKAKYIENILLEFTRLTGLLAEKNEPSFTQRLEESYRKYPPYILSENSTQKDSKKNSIAELPPMLKDKVLIEIFKEFFSEEYTPPYNIVELQAHLWALSIYYRFLIHKIGTISISTINRVDFALTKAVAQAMSFLVLSEHIGKKRLDRIFHSILMNKKKKASKKQPVIEEYYRIDKRGMLRPHRIATIIKERLEKRNLKVSVNTIKNYLKEEGLIK